jgi:hypothetical protein
MPRAAIFDLDHKHRKTGFSKSEWRMIEDARHLLAAYIRNKTQGIREPLLTASITVATHSATIHEIDPLRLVGALEPQQNTVQVDFQYRARILRKTARHIIIHNELPGRPMISNGGCKSILERSSVIRDWLSG